ncbi:uncharacterized protein LOC125420770 [Ziziphus jujuba]|uniref:Uncharacterized protein LOC125420770 n=1 Tax=Ziziphus jujuba TaxID=326968 RepID=A0ABM3I9D6_ZIZJJ|nr:uncharacterized protein LOC125420770 [Ziziphus jujuba]
MSKMEDLLKELVIPILLHLPAEDLVRCKSVCKALYSIITSRPFIDVRRKIRNSYILVKYEEDPINRHHAISLLSDETLEIIDTQPVFDISNEVFVTTPLPLPCIIESHDCRNRLMFHNKSLALDHCVKDRNNDTETHNIWVLGEYGVKESWTNLFDVGPFEPCTKSRSGFWNNNKVLLQVNGGGCRHHLILVDPSNRKIKDLDIQGTLMQLFHCQERVVQIIACPPINLF